MSPSPPSPRTNTSRGRDRERFISGLARHLDAVNHLHPFREGNGRTQRIFFSQLSGRAGYLLHWDRISAEENAAASRVGAAAWPPLLERWSPCQLKYRGALPPSRRGGPLAA